MQAVECGKYGKPLFDGVPSDVNSSILERQACSRDVPVLIDIWTSRRAQCKSIATADGNAAEQAEPDAKIVKLSSDRHRQIVTKLGIRESRP